MSILTRSYDNLFTNFSTVSESGSYNDLLDLPVLGTASVEDTTAFVSPSQLVKTSGTFAVFNLTTGELNDAPQFQFTPINGTNFYTFDNGKTEPTLQDLRNVHTLSMDLESTVDIFNEYTALTHRQLQFDPNQTNFSYGDGSFGGIGLENNYISHPAAGQIGLVQARNTRAVFGSDATPIAGSCILALINTDNVTVGQNYSIQDLRINSSNASFLDSSTINNYTGFDYTCEFSANTSLTGAFYSGRISSSHLTGSVLTSDINQLETRTSLETGAEVAGVVGFDTTIQNEGAISYATGVNVSFQGDGTYNSSPDGVRIYMGNYNNATERRTGLNIQNGLLSVYGKVSTSSDIEFDQANNLNTVFAVNATEPIVNTAVIVNNFASLFEFADDFTIGTALDIGASGLGFVGEVIISAGKTATEVNMALGGTSIGDVTSDFPGPLGGTISRLNIYRAVGVIDFGGANDANIEEVRGFSFGAGSLGNKVWGLDIEDPLAENHIAKSLIIGVSANEVSNSDVALELADKKALKLAPMTGADRDNLVPLMGMIVYISDPNIEQLEIYNGTAWVRTAQYVDVPPTATSPGLPGQIAIEPGFLYTCVALDEWERTGTVTF